MRDSPTVELTKLEFSKIENYVCKYSSSCVHVQGSLATSLGHPRTFLLAILSNVRKWKCLIEYIIRFYIDII